MLIFVYCGNNQQFVDLMELKHWPKWLYKNHMNDKPMVIKAIYHAVNNCFVNCLMLQKTANQHIDVRYKRFKNGLYH